MILTDMLSLCLQIIENSLKTDLLKVDLNNSAR